MPEACPWTWASRYLPPATRRGAFQAHPGPAVHHNDSFESSPYPHIPWKFMLSTDQSQSWGLPPQGSPCPRIPFLSPLPIQGSIQLSPPSPALARGGGLMWPNKNCLPSAMPASFWFCVLILHFPKKTPASAPAAVWTQLGFQEDCPGSSQRCCPPVGQVLPGMTPVPLGPGWDQENMAAFPLMPASPSEMGGVVTGWTSLLPCLHEQEFSSDIKRDGDSGK